MKRILRSVALLAGLLLLSGGCLNTAPAHEPTAAAPAPATTSPPAAQQPLPTPKEIQPPGFFGSPIMSGNRLFWLGATQRDFKDRAIYMQEDGSDQAVRVLESSPDWYLGFPDATGDWLTVSENPRDMAQQESWRLLAKNLRTGELRMLDRAATGAVQLRVAVDDDRVVWLENDWTTQEQSRSRIKMHNLATNTTQTLVEATAPENIESVSLSGHLIAYVRFITTPTPGESQRNRFSGDVYLYDLSGGTSQRLTESHDAWGAQIYGDHIVWKIGPHFGGYADLMLYSLRTGQAKQITHDGLERGIVHPTIGEGFVTWWENAGQGRAAIYLIAEGRIVAFDQAQGSGATAYGKNLTWRREISPEEHRIRYLRFDGR